MGHLSALLKKNWILWKRGGCCSYLEILFPLILISVFFLMRSLIEQKDIDAQSYIERNLTSEKPQILPIPLYADFPVEFDQMPLEQRRFLGPMMKNCIDNERNDNPAQNGFIAMSPKNEITETLEQYFKKYDYKTRYYKDRDALFKEITSQGYGEDVCLGISIEETKGNSYTYRLHFNTSTFDDDEHPDTNQDQFNTYQVQDIDDQLKPWAENGFLTIQNWIDNLIYQKVTNNNNLQITPSITSQKVEDHKDDSLPQVASDQFATFTILPLIIVFLRFLQQLLVEKEKKIRESMRIMGLRDSSLYLSWILYYTIIFSIISFFSMLICSATIFPNSNFILLWFWYLLYCINIMFIALCVSVFFTSSKIGNIAGMVVYVGFYILVFVVTNNSDMDIDTKTQYSILPQVSVTLGAKVFALIENKKHGIGWGDLNLVVEKYTVGRSLLMMVVSLIIFVALFFYLDQVVPNEFGAKRHPCFCFMWLKKKAEKVLKINDEDKIAQQNEDNIEPVEAVLKEKEMNGEALIIKNLSKVYDSGKRAVNNLSLTMYKDHISCFLGHNGAGKTTTISMLTGMTSITDGSASAFGFDVQDQMSELRHIMGVCPQHDILFDNLTCKEHLELIATFKGVKDKQQMENEINQMLTDVDLMFKKDALSKTLSGGQKRRLSVAMAFIGGSKLVYLDEPTSGCDTSVRRHIWDMLRRYKQDRIIILTTHFMDEADYLGDRISIIGEGKLICSGSSGFLKNKFGVGYNLTIVKEDTNTPTQPIIDLVMKHIPEAKKVSDVSAELSFQLKMQDIDKFQGLFDELDSQQSNMQISNYGISITTMEEVFLKVAENDADDLKNNSQLVRQSSLKRQNSREQQEQMAKNNPEEIDNFDLNKVRETAPLKVFFIHFWALAWKRFHFFKRDRKGIICEIVIPVAFLIMALFTLTSDGFVESPPQLLEPGIFEEKQPVLYGASTNVNKAQIDSYIGQFTDDYKFEYSESNTLADFDEQNFKKRKEERRGAYYFNEATSTKVSYLVQAATLNKDVAPLYVNEMNEAIIRQNSGISDFKLNVYIHPFDFTAKFKSLQDSDKGIGAAFVFALILSFIPCSLVAYMVKERAENIKHQQIVSGVSLQAYWLSTYFLDFMKFLFPLCTLCIVSFFAFDLDFYTEDGEVFSCIFLLFVLYGYSIIPWTYAFSFLCKTPGNAQVLSFFLHYFMGGLLPLIVWIFRVFVESAKDYAIAATWILRIIPSFCFGDSLISIASRETYMLLDDDITELQSPYHIDIAGADIIFLVVLSPLSLLAVAIFERLKSKGTVDKLIAKQAGCPQYTQKMYDDDVEQERQQIERSQKEDFVIRLNKMRKVFKQGNIFNEAVDSVSFGIKQGECFTLLGINGAGKTTLFKMLTGDHICTSGEAHINGYDVSTEMDQARYNIGYCPQFDTLLENLTTREHLELYAAIKGIPKNVRKELIDKKIKEMDLEKFEHIPAGTYSGGNKRKLSVAIAMIGNPPVVLLDEPSTGMDPKARRFMWDVISRISTQRKSSSIILTTHSMEEAEALSTRMCIMVQGNLKCLGSIQHIKSKFGQGYEIEVKVNLPSQDNFDNILKQAGLQQDLVITQGILESTLQKLNWMHYLPCIAPGQQANDLYNQMVSAKGLKLQHLLEFFLIESQGVKVQQFIEQQFQKYSIIEHFGAFTRYKILTDIPIGKIFGAFEQNKAQLDIASYSVKQTTIEAIFNNFATGKINTADFNKGGQFYKDHNNPQAAKGGQQEIELKQKTVEQQNKAPMNEPVNPEQIKIDTK